MDLNVSAQTLLQIIGQQQVEILLLREALAKAKQTLAPQRIDEEKA